MDEMLAIQILTGPVAIMLVGYALGMISLAFAVQPMRLAMVRSIDDMLSETNWTKQQRERLFMLRDHNMSFMVGLIVPLAAVGMIIDELLNRNGGHDDDRLDRDPRYAKNVMRFFASVAAANPLAALASVSFMVISVLIGLAFQKNKSARTVVDEAIEEPTLRALERFSAVC